MKIIVSDDKSYIWEPIGVRVEGCIPEEKVGITSVLQAAGLELGGSSFEMAADAQGVIDFWKTPALKGSYHGADPFGFLWSMENVTPLPSEKWREDQTVVITCTQKKTTVTGRFTRETIRPDVTVMPVSIKGAVAEYFLPAQSNGNYLITFGGSDGGLNGGRKLAQFFSSFGYPCVAIAYFGLPGIAPELYAIPLEIIEDTIKLIKTLPGYCGKLGIGGISRGGELSLLASSYFRDIHVTLAYVPSSILWESEDIIRHGPSWSYRGKELPYVLCDWSDSMEEMNSGRDWASTPVYLKAMEQTDMVRNAQIPLEKINGDVFLVSGKADAVWNSSQLCSMAVEYLSVNHFPHRVVHLDYDGVGHGVFSTGISSTMRTFPTFRGQYLMRGGDPAVNAHAQAEIRRKSLEFLKEAF